MHQKKSEVQIGKESSGVSSDFNPTPPFAPPSLHHKQHNPQTYSNFGPNFGSTLASSPAPPPSPSSSSSVPDKNNNNSSSLHIIINENDPVGSVASPTTKTTPHKRPHLGHSQFSTKSSNSLIKSPTLSNSLHKYPFSSGPIAKSQPLYKFLSNFRHRRLLRHIQLVDYVSTSAWFSSLPYRSSISLSPTPATRSFLIFCPPLLSQLRCYFPSI